MLSGSPKIDPEVGLATAIDFKKITKEQADALTDNQKELFGYFNALGLIGLTIKADARTMVDAQGNAYKQLVFGSSYWTTTPQTIDLGTFLCLTTEQAERLNNSYIAGLVQDKTDYIGGSGVRKGYLSLKEVFDLTDRQYSRITAEIKNIASRDFDARIVNNYADILHTRRNDPKKAAEHKAKALYFLEVIDPEYMPDSIGVSLMLEALSLEDAKAVAHFKPEQINVLLDHNNLTILSRLSKSVIDYSPHHKMKRDEDGRAIGPLKRGPVLAIKDLGTYSADQIKSIITAHVLLDKGMVSVNDAAHMQEEEANIASQLSCLMQDGETLEDVTGGEFKTHATASKAISLMDAWALSALCSGIRCIANISSAEAYAQAKKLKTKFDQALEAEEIEHFAPQRGSVGYNLDDQSFEAFLRKHLTTPAAQ